MFRNLRHIAAALIATGLLAAGSAAPAEPPANAAPPPKPNSLGADWRLQQDEVRQGACASAS